MIAAVFLSGQGYCDHKFDLTIMPSIHPSPSFFARSNRQASLTADADTGLVTFGNYECDKGGKADGAPVERAPRRLQAGRAGSRVVLNDVLKIRPFGKGLWAGCDAGKGAMELAAGSLALKEHIRGMPGVSAGCAR
ncbi:MULTISPECIES: hypothetical protein [unclassified Rhizobium]|uniref:hypothetical protein n=1 Tax=unclassified Rhizobium TaxID=2613769 RepID=UPI001FD8F1E0|nr:MULTISPECIES: hypothetical protein [unclassified Rhizobium]